MSVSPERIEAIRVAIIEGRIDKVRLLLKAGVPVDARAGRWPLITCAASAPDVNIFDLLIDNGADTAIEGLLAHAASGNPQTGNPSLEIVEKLLSIRDWPASEMDAALRYASTRGDLGIMKLLIERGADPNAKDDLCGFFPLCNAVRYGHADAVQLLVQAGAVPSLHTINEDVSTTDDEEFKQMDLIEFAQHVEQPSIREYLIAQTSNGAG